MRHSAATLKPVVATLLLLALLVAAPRDARADAALDALFAELAAPGQQDWQRVEAEIWRAWSKSGSAAMDLLLQRGRDAMAVGDLPQAIEHLTALTDHAPDFAEGWNARATAYYQAGEFGPALADIRRTLALEPRHFGALMGFGMILEELKQPDKALEVYRAALVIHPNLPALQEAIARVELETEGAAL